MPSTAGDSYLSDEDLFGSPATEEASLPGAIAASLDLAASPDATTRIYAPLGVGKHVDHQIVHQRPKSWQDEDGTSGSTKIFPTR